MEILKKVKVEMIRKLQSRYYHIEQTFVCCTRNKISVVAMRFTRKIEGNKNKENRITKRVCEARGKIEEGGQESLDGNNINRSREERK